jgi:hypothetical protein
MQVLEAFQHFSKGDCGKTLVLKRVYGWILRGNACYALLVEGLGGDDVGQRAAGNVHEQSVMDPM